MPLQDAQLAQVHLESVAPLHSLKQAGKVRVGFFLPFTPPLS